MGLKYFNGIFNNSRILLIIHPLHKSACRIKFLAIFSSFFPLFFHSFILYLFQFICFSFSFIFPAVFWLGLVLYVQSFFLSCLLFCVRYFLLTCWYFSFNTILNFLVFKFKALSLWFEIFFVSVYFFLKKREKKKKTIHFNFLWSFHIYMQFLHFFPSYLLYFLFFLPFKFTLAIFNFSRIIFYLVKFVSLPLFLSSYFYLFWHFQTFHPKFFLLS